MREEILRAKVARGEYNPDQSLPAPERWADMVRLKQTFKIDALQTLGILEHPRADRLFELAWEYGHGNGYIEVFLYMQDLQDLLP